MLQSLIFDIGNVLLHFDFEVAYARLEKLCSRFNEGTIREVERLKVLCESGVIDRTNFLRASMDVLSFQGDLRSFESVWQEIFSVNEPMVDFARSMHGRYPLFLLSNTSELHVEYFLRNYPFFSLFQDAIYSHEVHLTKPEPAIFSLAIEKFGVDPDQTAYIDDLLANIKSARTAGFRGLHYDVRGHDLFLSEITPLLEV